MAFVIRRLNPLIDLEADKIPQIFTDHLTSRRPESSSDLPEAAAKKLQEDIKSIVYAGVVKPDLLPIGKAEERGHEKGITADDLFRDQEIGMRLYIAIIDHSMLMHRGMKGLFFSLIRKLWLFTFWRKNTEKLRLRWYSQAEVIQ